MPNGSYQVTLKFAEFAVSKATERTMKITIEGVVVEPSFSIIGSHPPDSAVIGMYTAYDRTYTTTVSDGILNIAFARSGAARKDPVVSAVEVVRVN